MYQQRSDNNLSNSFSKKEQRTPVRKLVTPSSSLEIVDGGKDSACGFYDDRTCQDSVRSWSRSSAGSIPPRSDSSLNRRTVTPTKQVSLQAVRRKEESSVPFVDHIDVGSVRTEDIRPKAWDYEPSHDFSQLSTGDNRQSDPSKQDFASHSSHTNPGQTQKALSKPLGQQHNKHVIDNKDIPSSSSDEDDDDEEDEDKDENEKLKAPTELLMEFIDCLMKKDFPNASKLCKMILLYEPENEEALKFQPLIEEKMALDAAAEDEEGSGDEDDDDDDDDDDSDDSSSDDSDESSEESDDDDEEKNAESNNPSTSSVKSDFQNNTNGIVGANTTRVWKPAS